MREADGPNESESERRRRRLERVCHWCGADAEDIVLVMLARGVTERRCGGCGEVMLERSDES